MPENSFEKFEKNCKFHEESGYSFEYALLKRGKRGTSVVIYDKLSSDMVEWLFKAVPGFRLKYYYSSEDFQNGFLCCFSLNDWS